jgi:tRNA nucleotidyltransferase (CCA-adding enzyme)
LLDLAHLLQGLDLQNIVSIESSTLSPRSWPLSLEWLPSSAFLVGGSVRDALLGRESDYLDLDFVLPDGVVDVAKAIARHYKAGFVLLDAERQIARVVFAQGTVDFAQQVGATLEADLWRRDFTVNAIAYNPQLDRFVDPLQGCQDLQRRIIRMVSPENLEEDPLRLLRAYRQAAQLGFTLDAETQYTIRRFAPLLQHIAAERVQSELNFLLSTAKGTPWLDQAWQDGLLQDWLPSATAESMRLIAEIDRGLVLLQETHPQFAKELFGRVSVVVHTGDSSGSAASKASGSARHWLITAKLACLLHFAPDQAEAQLRKLKYSRHEIQAVNTVLKGLPHLCDPTKVTVDRPVLKELDLSLGEQYAFFQTAGATFPAIAILGIAYGISLDAMAPLLNRYMTPTDPVAHAQPPLTGQELMTQLNLPPGPLIGHLLAALQLAKAEGRISTICEALELAAAIVAEKAESWQKKQK